MAVGPNGASLLIAISLLRAIRSHPVPGVGGPVLVASLNDGEGSDIQMVEEKISPPERHGTGSSYACVTPTFPSDYTSFLGVCAQVGAPTAAARAARTAANITGRCS
jgi:hypothetical protein